MSWIRFFPKSDQIPILCCKTRKRCRPYSLQSRKSNLQRCRSIEHERHLRLPYREDYRPLTIRRFSNRKIRFSNESGWWHICSRRSPYQLSHKSSTNSSLCWPFPPVTHSILTFFSFFNSNVPTFVPGYKNNEIFYPKAMKELVPFASGSGYGLSSDLIHFLVKNLPMLTPYYNEVKMKREKGECLFWIGCDDWNMVVSL